MTLYVVWYFMNTTPSSVLKWGGYANNSTEALSKFEDYLTARELNTKDVTIYNLQKREV